MGKRWIVLMCIAAVMAGCATTGDSAKAPKLRVGVASATVNPPDGIFMGGYDHNRRSTGVHDNLYAKAVVFSEGKDLVALVVLDSLGLQYPTVQDIRAAAAAKTPALAPERIVVQATHTHCSPDTAGIYGPDEEHTGFSPEYAAQLAKTVADVVARAVAALEPARLKYAITECKGWAVNDSEPKVLDNSVTILECTDLEGRSLATLTNFACHPTVLDGDNTLISADWVGAFYKSMSAGLPGEHLFLQGAIGCWMQPETPERTFALAEKYGNDLAAKTLAALPNAKPIEKTAIRFANKTFEIPVANAKFRMMSMFGLVPRKIGATAPTEVAWFAVGSVQFATLPGEAAPMFADEARAMMKTGPKFVLGLGLDHMGYICPPRYFEKPADVKFADYLTDMSPGPQAGPAMIAALRSIIP